MSSLINRGAGPKVALRYNHQLIIVFKHLPTMIINPRTPNISLKHIHSLHTLQENKIFTKIFVVENNVGFEYLDLTKIFTKFSLKFSLKHI